jgi:hypothetical protein
MGEAFISSKKERFQHQRDKQFEEQLATEDLLSGLPDVTTTLYRCVLTAKSSSVRENDRVLIADLGEQHLTVLWKNQVIGYVDGHDGNKLRAFLAGSARKMLVGVVHSMPKVGNTFTVALEIQ